MKNLKANLDAHNRRVYTSTDILRIGIKRERLKDWMERRLVGPSIQKAKGQGTANLFSIQDLYLIKLFERLLSRGLLRIDAELRIRWLSKLIQGAEEKWWDEILFLIFINIASEQNPILKILADQRLAAEFIKATEQLPKEDYERNFGSFLPIPIDDDFGTNRFDALHKYDAEWLSIKRKITDDCDDIILVNIKKMKAEINALVN